MTARKATAKPEPAEVESDAVPDVEPEPAEVVEASNSALVVAVPFAYAHAKSGEMKQLVKGDVIDPEKYRSESIEHLVSIGFVTEQD